MNSPHPRSATIRLVAIAGFAFSLSACGEPSEERVPVYRTSGKITFQDKPLAGALVLFRKAEVDTRVPSPTAITGEDGSFTLHTYESDDGAPEGEYLVAVSIRTASRDSGGGGMFSKKQGEVPVAVLKGRYADPKTSGLKATIKPGPNDLSPFDLGGPGTKGFAAPASTVGSAGRGR